MAVLAAIACKRPHAGRGGRAPLATVMCAYRASVACSSAAHGAQTEHLGADAKVKCDSCHGWQEATKRVRCRCLA